MLFSVRNHDPTANLRYWWYTITKKSKKSESYRKQGEYGAKKFIKP